MRARTPGTAFRGGYQFAAGGRVPGFTDRVPSHLADVLPEALRFILGPISALLTLTRYMTIRQQESELYLKRRPL